MKKDINKIVKHIISRHLGVEESKIKEVSNLTDDLGADSLDTIELVMAFEEEFDKEIPDKVAENFRTVQDIIDYLQKS